MKRNLVIEKLYQQQSLDEIYKTARTLPNDRFGHDAFSKFHKDMLEGLVTGFRINFLATSSIRLCRNFQPDGVQSILLNLPEKIVENYNNIAHHDVIAPVVYKNPGRIIKPDMIFNEDIWLNHPFFEAHCKLFDIHRAMMVGYLYPGKDWQYVTVEYLGTPDNLTWHEFDYEQLEMATFPFVLAWLYRNDALDDSRLARYFWALHDLTASELLHIRKYINCQHKQLKQQARELGIKEDTLKKSLYTIRDKVSYRFDWETGVDRSSRKILNPFTFEYHFMKMLGDPTQMITTY